MSRETLIQTAFNAGIMSERLHGRTDFQKYGNALAALSNAIPLVAGPVTFRPGTVYVDTTLDTTKKSRLIPFKFNSTQTYMMEFGDQKIRFYRNRTPVLSTAAFTNGTFNTDLTGWTDADTGTGVSDWNSNAMRLNGGASGDARRHQALTYLGIEQYTITANVTGGAVTVKVGTTAGGTEIASGTIAVGTGSTFSFTPTTAQPTWYVQFSNANNDNRTIDSVVLSTPEYTIDSPYDDTELTKISYAQDLDVMYLAFPSTTIKPRVLLRYGHDKWQLKEMTFLDGPYLATNKTSTTITPSGTSGSITLTASTAIFASTDVGRLVRLSENNQWGWLEITAYTSTTQVTATVKGSALSATFASTGWRLGAFSQTTGYPAIVTFHEGRLTYANTQTNTHWIWFSESQGYGQDQAAFAPSEINNTVTDSNAVFFPLTAGEASSILWMSSGSVLAVGTVDGEWVVEAGDNSKAFSPSNARQTRRTNHGSRETVQAVRVDGTVLYAKRTGRRINKFSFNFAKDAFESSSMSSLADAIFTNRNIDEMVYCPDPHNLVWVRFDDGKLASLTFVDSEEVGGWAEHTLAGALGSSNAFVESIAQIPSEDLSYSELWMVVKRTIDGADTRYIEILSKPYFKGTNRETATYLDCHKVYDGTATTSITGLGHLEGEEVVAYADGAEITGLTVSSGAITLPDAASYVVTGLYYAGDGETLDFEASNAFSGSSLGQIRRITETSLRVFETGIIYAGPVEASDSELSYIEPRTSEDLMDAPPALKTGIFKVDARTGWGLRARLRFQMRAPQPATLCAVMFKAQVNEG